MKKTLRILICCLFPVVAFAGEVEQVCKSQLPILTLDFRQSQSNLTKIKSADLGSSDIGKFLSNFYKTKAFPQDEKSLIEAVNAANKSILKSSVLKDNFLKYATSSQRTQDPKGYRETVLSLIKDLIPESTSKLKWFLTLKDPQISKTELTPASGSEMDNTYGAVFRLEPIGSNKYESKIIFSNNESEPLPYLLPLIVHELRHAFAFKGRIEVYSDEKKYMALAIVDEANGFDIQMQTYIALAKKHPELFCNWLYVTWAYGDIPVPLAWTMASLERELSAGYIYKYAKMGEYKDAKYLLNKEGTDLRPDLKNQIRSLNLKFVR